MCVTACMSICVCLLYVCVCVRVSSVCVRLCVCVRGSVRIRIETRMDAVSVTHRNTLQHTATHCATLRHTAKHCNTLRHTVVERKMQRLGWRVGRRGSVCSFSIVTHRNKLQHTATHCQTMHHTAIHQKTLQHTRLLRIVSDFT